ncbi:MULTISPECIES: N-acetylmuramoyl-L-alanine amidase [Streptomyces]|uniref:N-acetylmuramoyl-L-alanine amidase n=1 Tax=Streptomyces viridochromogenes TaxID=1938 RepID=A0A0L8J9J6_STRVR|nr:MULTISPECIES: N-acetylmuramoyl-L-alanine amidase [Streptomyces]KOG10372.1 amidase [Streptomyces viridochromogenes]
MTRPVPRRRVAGAAAVVTVLMTAALATPPAQARSSVPTERDTGAGKSSRAELFREAGERHHVPETVLLAVSYLQSRWDDHRGAPSVDAGFGPMHLTDARAALAETHHHSSGHEDPRGDASRPPLVHREAPVDQERLPASLETLGRAAALTGLPAGRLRTDPAANIEGGAALLADHQRSAGLPLSADPAQWYAAVAAYSGAGETGAARRFADDVFSLINAGESRRTDDGTVVTLSPVPVRPETRQLERLGLKATVPGAECPRDLGCDWTPAPYRMLSAEPGDFGNHDLSDRPHNQAIDYIVIHDTEATWDTTLKLVQDPTYVSWHYSLRSADGHIANHLRAEDVGWHAGNWYVNSKSIGLEHEGFLAEGGQWYTEAMYRTSARLVRHLAKTYDVPLDRAHVIGHDNVPGTVPANVAGMHQDPGPYWDWDHYFDLLGKPFKAHGKPTSPLVTIRPDYDSNTEPYYCGATPADLCPVHGSASITLRSEPRDDAPLVTDVGIRPSPGTWSVYNHAARVSTGQKYVVAEHRGDWTALWYLGQKGWFENDPRHPMTLPSKGLVARLRPGLDGAPLYGRAYPEPAAYPAGIPVQPLVPLQYTLRPGQFYSVGQTVNGEYYHSKTFELAGHTVVRGALKYHQVQFGHRIMFVKADDVVLTSAAGLPRVPK